MHASPRLGLQRHPPAQRRDAVAYVTQSVARRPSAMLGDLEENRVAFDMDVDRRLRTLAGALEHLQTTEVHSPRNLGRVARPRLDLDARRNSCTHRSRA